MGIQGGAPWGAANTGGVAPLAGTAGESLSSASLTLFEGGVARRTGLRVCQDGGVGHDAEADAAHDSGGGDGTALALQGMAHTTRAAADPDRYGPAGRAEDRFAAGEVGGGGVSAGEEDEGTKAGEHNRDV